MLLHLARHGQTDLNIDDRLQGRADPPLNATGHAQALALAARVPATVQVIVSSTQLRARQTAQPAAERLGLPLVTMAEFRERDFGVLDGLTPAEAAAREPALWATGGVWQWDAWPERAERTQDVVDRVRAGLLALHDRYANQEVLLVSHGFTTRALRFWLEGVAREHFFTAQRLDNGALMTVPAEQVARALARLRAAGPGAG